MMLRRLTRRTILGAATLFTLVPSLACASPATDFVTQFGGQLTETLNAHVPMTEKYTKILPLLRQNVDIQGIGRYCLGRYWRTATPEQQAHYLKLFEDVLLNAVTAQMGNYENVSLKMTGSVPTPAGEKVTLLISRPHQPDITMMVVIEGTPPKVVDLYGEGASMRMTQRSDYTAYLMRNGGNIETLITALENQIARNQAAAARK